jgi:hypothetical protein
VGAKMADEAPIRAAHSENSEGGPASPVRRALEAPHRNPDMPIAEALRALRNQLLNHGLPCAPSTPQQPALLRRRRYFNDLQQPCRGTPNCIELVLGRQKRQPQQPYAPNSHFRTSPR